MKKSKIKHRIHTHIKNSERDKIKSVILIKNHNEILKGTIFYVSSVNDETYTGWIEYTNQIIEMSVPKSICKDVEDISK